MVGAYTLVEMLPEMVKEQDYRPIELSDTDTHSDETKSLLISGKDQTNTKEGDGEEKDKLEEKLIKTNPSKAP